MYMFETPGVVPEGSLQPEGKWHAYNSTPYSREVPSRVPQKEVTQKNWKNRRTTGWSRGLRLLKLLQSLHRIGTATLFHRSSGLIWSE